MFPVIVAPVVPGDTTLQTIVALVAFIGAIVPVRVSRVPAVVVVATPVMFVTGTKGTLTVTIASSLVRDAVCTPLTPVLVLVTTTR
jgi:hypothetical protein